MNILSFFSMQSMNPNYRDRNQNKQLKMHFPANITNLGDIERISPLKYLALKSEYILDDNNKIIINGDLVNTASLAKYKDVVIQVFCINAEGAIIKREKVVAVDNIPANSRLSFKVALMAANGTRKVIVKLFDASGVK